MLCNIPSGALCVRHVVQHTPHGRKPENEAVNLQASHCREAEARDEPQLERRRAEQRLNSGPTRSQGSLGDSNNGHRRSKAEPHSGRWKQSAAATWRWMTWMEKKNPCMPLLFSLKQPAAHLLPHLSGGRADQRQ